VVNAGKKIAAAFNVCAGIFPEESRQLGELPEIEQPRQMATLEPGKVFGFVFAVHYQAIGHPEILRDVLQVCGLRCAECADYDIRGRVCDVAPVLFGQRQQRIVVYAVMVFDPVIEINAAIRQSAVSV